MIKYLSQLLLCAVLCAACACIMMRTALAERVREATVASDAYNTEAERQAVLDSIDAAATVFESRR